MKITDAIKVLRFPLIVLVVYIHMSDSAIGDWGNIMESGRPFYSLLTINLPRLFCDIAVPIFFIISGYLFFLKTPDKFGKEEWSSQLSKRWHTLVIPYFIWNTLSYMATALKRVLFPGTMAQDPHGDLYFLEDFKTIYWDWPLDYPLWYVRELILIALVAPLFYYGLKKAPILFLLATTAYYLFAPAWNGFNSHAVFYFSVGAYLSIHHIKELSIPTVWIVVSGVISLTMCLLHIMNPIPSIRHLFESFYFISTIVCFCGLFFRGNLSHPIYRWFERMGKYVFIIFVLHNIYLINFARGLNFKLMQMGSGLTSEVIGVIGYLIIPWLVIAVCVAAYEILDRAAPRLLRIAIGGRKTAKVTVK